MDEFLYRIRRSFPDPPTVNIYAAHSCLSFEGDELGVRHFRHGPSSQPILLCELNNASAFGCLISQRSQLSGIGHFLDRRPSRGYEFRGLTIPQGYGAGLVQ